MAVSLSVANEAASLPVAWRLYLPEEWAHDGGRRRKAGVPEGVEFATKPAIALAQIEAALQAGVPKGVVLAAVGYGAGYGADMKFQARLAELGLDFVFGVQPRAKIWIDGHQPLPPEPWPELWAWSWKAADQPASGRGSSTRRGQVSSDTRN